VDLNRLFELLPQIAVFDRLLAGGLPPFGPPFWKPLGDASLEIGGVGEKLDAMRFAESAEGLDGSDELHPVVGRLALAS